MDIAEYHARALDATGLIVEQIRPEQLELVTGCEGWDVRFMLNHVIAGNWWATELADGKTIAEVGDRLDGDCLGDDPQGAYYASAKAAAEIFRQPGALERPCAVSYGPVSGEIYAGHRFIDVLIHGWDLANATGQDDTLDPELVAACAEVVAPQAALLTASGAFANMVEVSKDADDQTRLLAMLGRSR